MATQVLLVEDSPTDVLMTWEAVQDAGLRVDLCVVNDGVGALDYLRRRGPYSDATRPALILLDLNLPRKDGREVLQELKQDPELASIPVVVFTSSCSEEDRRTACRLHANSYVIKPVDLDGFQEAVRGIVSFWLTIATLPGDPPPR